MKDFLYLIKRNIKVYSFHDFAVKSVGDLFDIVAYSCDGVIEAIESKDSSWLSIGVQYHPELENNSVLIKSFIDKIRNKKHW